MAEKLLIAPRGFGPAGANGPEDMEPKLNKKGKIFCNFGLHDYRYGYGKFICARCRKKNFSKTRLWFSVLSWKLELLYYSKMYLVRETVLEKFFFLIFPNAVIGYSEFSVI